mmetsp:Transcript_8329/g.17989  ORF Transcript_8329/g.17989 Transcript_8329/m.17989 type:complete len:221 (-) Transcript_8329:155-817(-)
MHHEFIPVIRLPTETLFGFHILWCLFGIRSFTRCQHEYCYIVFLLARHWIVRYVTKFYWFFQIQIAFFQYLSSRAIFPALKHFEVSPRQGKLASSVRSFPDTTNHSRRIVWIFHQHADSNTNHGCRRRCRWCHRNCLPNNKDKQTNKQRVIPLLCFVFAPEPIRCFCFCFCLMNGCRCSLVVLFVAETKIPQGCDVFVRGLIFSLPVSTYLLVGRTSMML